MPARDVHHWIDRWERTGLVDADTASLLHDDATRAGAVPDVTDDAVDRVLSAARGGVVEALGYVGAALTVGAIAVLLDVAGWADLLLAGLLVVVAGGALAAMVWLTPPASAVTRRLAAVLGVVAVAATATAAAVGFGPEPGQAMPDRPGRELLVAVPALAVATVAYLRHRHLLTHAALGAAAVATSIGLGDLLVQDPDAWARREAVAGAIVLVVAVAWVWASEAGRLEPAWLGTPAGGLAAYVSVAVALSSVGSDGTGSVLGLLGLAAAATVVGVAASRLRVTIVGALGLLVAVPMTFVQVLGWSGAATAAVLLPVGVAVTAWAVVANRRPPTSPPDDPPARPA